MCVYAYVDAILIDVKRGYEFEGKWGGEQGRVWREKREERNVNIKFNLQNKQTNGKDDSALCLIWLVTSQPSLLLWLVCQQEASLSDTDSIICRSQHHLGDLIGKWKHFHFTQLETLRVPLYGLLGCLRSLSAWTDV